jgi:hypothetical protein
MKLERMGPIYTPTCFYPYLPLIGILQRTVCRLIHRHLELVFITHSLYKYDTLDLVLSENEVADVALIS